MTADDQRWRVVSAKSARKDLVPFRSVLAELRRKIAVLETNPDAGEERAGSLLGTRSLKFSLKGMGECRVAYVTITDQHICLLFLTATRDNFYEQAVRRYEALLRRDGLGI